ncbi:MAG: ATP-binding cassette domain-containing protein, partial [Deltaproteobacteria bacterium]|nr:ATP-binding cassette domain-containing protein [Deltaproteobacteria bacterium]
MNPFVEIENVTLSYSDELREPAVQDLSISIEEGEFSAVVGPSGCGKSTLMKLVTGLLFPQAGEVRVNGIQVDSPLKIAGMAFQNPVMLPWRKTLENLLLPLEIVSPHRERLRKEKKAYMEQAEELLKT